jgi:hypothetical protein
LSKNSSFALLLLLVCPDGTQAAGACVNNMCGQGYTCVKGLCCAAAAQTPKCLDGSQAVGACISGKCGMGYVCTTGNICCPSNANGKQLARYTGDTSLENIFDQSPNPRHLKKIGGNGGKCCHTVWWDPVLPFFVFS